MIFFRDTFKAKMKTHYSEAEIKLLTRLETKISLRKGEVIESPFVDFRN